MAQIYANEFTEQELKDLVDLLQVAARPETAARRASARSQLSMSYMNSVGAGLRRDQVNGLFRAEMKKRGKDI